MSTVFATLDDLHAGDDDHIDVRNHQRRGIKVSCVRSVRNIPLAEERLDAALALSIFLGGISIVTSTRPTSLDSELNQFGYVVLDGVMNAQEVAALRDFLAAAYEAHQKVGDPETGILSDSSLYDAMWPDFFQVNPSWFGVFCNDRTVDALHQTLGEPFILTRDSIVHWEYFPGWHTDTTTSETRGELSHLEPNWRMLTVGMYLQTGGGLEVVPGSHRARDPFVALRKQRDGVGLSTGIDQWRPRATLEVPLAPGDVIVFDMRLIHRAATSAPRDERGERCQKMAVFSRVSRNIPSHVAAYTDFRIEGAGIREDNLTTLRERGRQCGFLVA
jgi:hypothetical protein